MPWTTLAVLSWTSSRFAERGIPGPRLEAEVLLAHALKTTRVGLYTGFDKPLEEPELAAYRDLIKRRLAGEPVAYLVGEQEFWSLPLAVDARVLIPRRDTETLVEVALQVVGKVPRARREAPTGGAGAGAPAPELVSAAVGAAAAGAAAAGAAAAGAAVRTWPLRIADVATGSGAVALALARERPDARVVATDVSADALAVARANIERHAMGDRVEVRQGDLVAPLDGELDLIVSNPPYVPTPTIDGLAAEVRREPRLALDGGQDGLAIIRRLVPAALAHLVVGGTLAIEHGFDQGAAVRALFEAAAYRDVATVCDLAGNERVTSGKR